MSFPIAFVLYFSAAVAASIVAYGVYALTNK